MLKTSNIYGYYFFLFFRYTKEIKLILSNIGLRKRSSSLLFLVFFSGCIDMYLKFLTFDPTKYSTSTN